MIASRLALLSAVLIAGAVALHAPPAVRADASIESTSIENGYPRELIFTLTASADVVIEDVTLRYTIVGSNVGAIGKPEPEDFTPGTTVSTRVRVDTNPNTNWIPVGNTIEWYWELSLADGTTTTGPVSSFLYLPPDREWRTAESERAIIYYTGPREGLANEMLEAIDETYERHGRLLLKTELEPGSRVTVVVMGSNADLQEAQPSKGTTLDNSDAVVTCGFRPGNSKQLIFGTVSCAGSDPVDTIRHEFAHILNAAAGEGTLVKLPTWLEEGLAVYAQADPSGYEAAFEAAYRRNRLIPFREMSLPVADENLVILQYGQSYMMTRYLIEVYGIPKLNQLLDLTKANTRFDIALERVYGFDLAGFEKEFLAALGGAGPTPQPTSQQQPSQPTPAPTEARPQPQQPTPAAGAAGRASPDGDDNFREIMVLLVGLSVLLMLAAVMSFLLMLFLQNQRRPPASP